MSRKFSYQGVVVVLICILLMIYFNKIFRDAAKRDMEFFKSLPKESLGSKMNQI